MTKAQAVQLARRSRRYGYSDQGGGQVEVRCPQCGTRVQSTRGYRYRPARKGEPGIVDPAVLGGRRAVYEHESPAQAIDRAVTGHLLEGECTAGT